MGDLLQALGPMPSTVVVLDFETYFARDYQLRGSTMESYVRDPRFEVLGAGVRILGRGSTAWLEAWDFADWVRRVDWSQATVVANNACFDCAILAWHFGARPRLIVDTMAWGRLLHGEGGLAALAARYGLGEKGHELVNVKGLRRADITQAAWERLGVYCRQDVDLTAGLFERMAPRVPPLEWWVGDSTVRAFTEPRLVADLPVLGLALEEERARKRALLERIATPGAGDPLERARATLASDEQFASLLEGMGIEVETKTNAAGAAIPALAKSDPFMTRLLEHERDDVRSLAEARLAVRSTIVATRAERFAACGRRGAFPMPLAYARAHTHRWAGFDKMNVQNLPRGGTLRRALRAPPGQMVVVADSSQIEARVAPWLAGEETVLEVFRTNDAALARGEAEAAAQGIELEDYWAAHGGEPDFYAAMGSVFFRRTITKAANPVERQTSKAMILGLSYGLGWAKFAWETLKGMLGAKPVQFGPREVESLSVDVAAFLRRPYGRTGHTCEHEARHWHSKGARVPVGEWLVHAAVADHFVRVYRGTNSRIAALWRRCDELIPIMARDGDPSEVRARLGPLEVLRHAIRKPNGLVLRYPGLRRRADGWVYVGGKGEDATKKLYGGALTENLVQSLARDVMAEQAMWIRADGHPFVTTTHDEVVVLAPAAEAPAVLRGMLERMRVAPAWAPGLPLNAAGGLGENYGEAK